MKKIRKITSLLCVLSLLLTVCAVGLTSLGSAVTGDHNVDLDVDDNKPEVEIDYGDFGIPGEDNNNVWLNMHTDNGFGEKVKVVIGTPGEALPEVPVRNNEKGLGWKLDNADWIETVPESVDESREVHIYAVYPTKVYDFEKGMDDIFMPNGNKLGSFALSTAEDPLDSGRGTVLKMNSIIATGSTAHIPLSLVSGLGNSEGFKLNNGSSYTITMDVYLAENYITSGNNSFNFYYSAYAGVGNAGNKTMGTFFAQAEQDKFLATNTEGDHHWATITHTFTANVPDGRDYLLITWNFNGSGSADLKTTVYVDNIKIVETGDKVMEYICPTLKLNAMGGTLQNNTMVASSQGEKVSLPTPTKSGYIFAGWTKNYEIAAGTANNDYSYMLAEYGPTTIALAEGRTTNYYAIWAPKSVTYTFGSEDNVEFNSAVTTTERLTTGEGGTGSAGTVSTYISLEDCNGDGDFELKTNVTEDRTGNVYKANLAKFDGTKNDYYVLRENVTYRVTMKVKVAELRGGSAKVGVTRCFKTGFGQVNPEGSNQRDYFMVAGFNETTDEFVTVSKEFTTFGMFNTTYSGDPTDAGLGGAHAYKDGLAFVGYSGITYVDSITVEALSYNESTMEIIGEGTADIDYKNNIVTVKPAEGYRISANGIKILYNYHGYNYNTYGKFTATEEQIAHLRSSHEGTKFAFTPVLDSQQDGISFSYGANKYKVPPGGMKFIVTFIPDDEVSSAVIAKSVRTEKILTSGEYRSAGLRFRARVVDDSRISEVGFIAVPTEKIIGLDGLEFLANGKLNYSSAASVVAYNKDTGKNVVYTQGDGYKDYQLIITGLSILSGERDLRSTSFTVVSYVKYDDNGTVKYQYSEPMATSWDLTWNSYSDEVKNQFQ